MGFYSTLVRPLAFRLEAEHAHQLALKLGANVAWAARAVGPMLTVSDPRLETTVAGLHFPHPIGLAAGYDKSGHSIETLAALGFGSIEIGSVTIDASGGNPKPRLWRLPDDRAVMVHYGMPNDGAAAVKRRIERLRLPVPLGVNIAVTNRGIGAPPLKDHAIIDEYVAAARMLAPHADYLMLNMSCPNTEDGRDFFVDRHHIEACLTALGTLGLTIPVFMKVSPLGGVAAVERVLAAAEPHGFVSGFMFNLSPTRPSGLKTPEAVLRSMPGAVSGPAACSVLTDECLAECYRRMDRKRFSIVAAGGVFTAEDAYAKIRKGAALVQLLTAMIYEGPLLARRIARGLAALLERDGFKSVANAVGADAR
jgi:dihydroorotate dehydrogenase